MKYLIPIVFAALALIAVYSCPFRSCSGSPDGTDSVGSDATSSDHEEMNSVYYWKTVFWLDSAARDFISRHNIGRVYLRMFDVTIDEFDGCEDYPIPNASVRIGEDQYRLLTDSLTDMEFVPVVYITIDALRSVSGHENILASHIVKRVRNMCQFNGLPNVRELQLDCDWTASTEASFFSLCKKVRQQITALELPWRLSSTIRLHQLSHAVPPVDAGVLMVYNTGSFNDPYADNSIIDAEDVKPYLRHLTDYPLHIDVAYPSYSWQLLFHRRRFAGLMNGADLNDTAYFRRLGTNSFIALRNIQHNGRIILEDDIVRQENSTYSEVEEVRALIEKRLAGRPHSNIIYHLDSDNLSKYSANEIDKILSTGY